MPDTESLARSILEATHANTGQPFTNQDVRSLQLEIQQTIEDWLANWQYPDTPQAA
jgi:hypothetical protein